MGLSISQTLTASIWELTHPELSALAVSLLAVACTCWWRSRKLPIGRQVPFCDFESFYWSARKRLGWRFDTVLHGNRASGEGTDRFSWAVPNKDALACIARHLRSLPVERRHIVDFGSGSGYWSLHVKKFTRMMSLEGVRVTALDAHPELYQGKAWFPTQRGGVEALRALKDAGILLLVWPPCWEDMAMKALEAFRGDLIAYIGEGRGGCTAWHSFFDALEKGWVRLERVNIPNWHGRFACLYVYERATSAAAKEPLAGRGRACVDARSSDPTELLLPFFRGTGTDIQGRCLAEIRGYDFERMEVVHDYVQWMFPTDENSMFNLCAPLLTPSIQRAFAEDAELRRELRLNFERFCQFLGLEVEGDERDVRVAVGANFQERVPDCWISMFGSNHNWLRISRVLQCLGLCSLPHEQQALMACLEEISTSGKAQCSSAIPHWRQRARTVPAI